MVCYEVIRKESQQGKVPCCGSIAIHTFCLESWLASHSTCIVCSNTIPGETAEDVFKAVASPVKGSDAQILLELKKRKEPPEKQVTDESPMENYRRKNVEKGRRRQAIQAEKMKKRRTDSSTASVGNIVALKMDYRDVTHSQGVYGIVYDVSKSGAGDVCVVTQYGIVVTGQSKSPLWVPSDRYKILDNDVVLPVELLYDIRKDVLDGKFDPKKHPRITMNKAHVLPVLPPRPRPAPALLTAPVPELMVIKHSIVEQHE